MFSPKVLFVSVLVASFISLAIGKPFNPFHPGPVIPETTSTASPSTPSTTEAPGDYVTVNVTDLGQGPFIPGFKDPGAGPKPFDPFPGPVIPETPSTTSPPSSSTTEAPGDYVTVNVTDLGQGPFIPGFKDHGFKPLNPGPVIPQTPNTTSPPSSSTTEAPGDSIVVAVADLGLGPLILGFKDGVPGPREPVPSAGAPSV